MIRRPRRRRRAAAGLAAALAAAWLAAACDGRGGAPDAAAGEKAPTPATVAATGTGDARPRTIRRQPGLDVLLITVDTLRADALGAYGNPRGATPWMDRLAARGVRFATARAHNVVTLPSHATILSGLHPHEHGVRDNSGFRFPGGVDTLATILAARGYRTAAFVSAFPLDSRFGLDRGFELYEDGFVDAARRPAFVELERPGAETAALAARWLAAADGRPSFAWVHLYEPHFPYAPPPPFDAAFAGDPYLGDVAAADAALEPLLAPLLDPASEGDALVVLTSDHGESLGEHGEATHGIFAYEATLRVPLILHQPDLLAPRVVDEPARLIDLLPTILDLLGAPPPPGLPGRSLAPAAVDAPAASAPRATYFEALSGQLHRGWAPVHGILRDGWKYIRLPIPELYDLRTDPREERNLASREAERMAALEVALSVLLAGDGGATPAPEDAETRRRLESLGYLGGGATAKPAYTVEDDPKRLIELDAMLRRAVSLHAAGDLAAARSLCGELLRRRPDMRVALMTLAQIERDLGDLDAAAAAMRRAFELFPDDATALALLVSYLTLADRPGEAVEVSRTHVRRARPDVDVLFVHSLALARLGRPGEAMATLDRARELEPGNPMVAVHFGTLHLMAGRRWQARAAFEEALALDGDTVRAHTSLAVLASEEGRTEEAVAHWRRAVSLEPREHSKLLSIAAGLWSANRRAEARPLLELFAESAPSADFAAEVERVRELLAAP